MPERQLEDLSYLKTHWQDVNDKSKASLLRRHCQYDIKLAAKLHQILDGTQWILTSRLMAIDNFAQQFAEKYGASSNDSIQRVQLINAAVDQATLRQSDALFKDELLRSFMQLLNREDDIALRSRLLRAIGQCHLQRDDVYQLCSKELKLNSVQAPSVYACLADLDCEESAQIIFRRLQSIIKDRKFHDETAIAIKSLSRFSQLTAQTSPLKEMPKDFLVELQEPLLKILSMFSCRGMEDFIVQALESSGYTLKMLALAASVYNQNDSIAKKIMAMLNHDHKAIRERALDSLCRGGSRESHKYLFELIETGQLATPQIEKVFQSLVPEAGRDYSFFIQKIDRWIKQDKLELLKSENILAKLLQVRDYLSAYLKHDDTSINDARLSANDGQEKSRDERLSSVTPAAKTIPDAHSMDAKLIEEYENYTNFPEPVKLTLRNTEVIFNHPDLYDKGVDKSPIIVQYVKAIDLLLQHFLGPKIFGKGPNGKEHALTMMQTRVYLLQLDNYQGSYHNLMSELQCQPYFYIQTFPGGKIQSICSDILSGKLAQEQYRIIDGIRAWSVMILLFVRGFRYRDKTLASLFLQQTEHNSAYFTSLCADMNELQVLRNEAAHRRTVVDMNQLQQVRQKAKSIIQRLQCFA